MTPPYQSPVTHAETAWLAGSVPLFLTLALILAFALLLEGRLRAALTGVLLRRALARQRVAIDPALLWTPPVASAGQLLGACLFAALSLVLALSIIAPLFIAVVLAGPASALLIWLLLWLLEQRYIAALDRALPAAVGRLEAQLRSGSGLQTALQRVLTDMPEGPLRAEWQVLVTRLGTPLGAGTLATPQHVVTALLSQTPSRRHAAFLGHLELALEQPHSAMVQRVRAAYVALQAAEQRRSAAQTELAQMRYSGVAIGLAGVTMALYLAATQQQRVVAAYQGPLGAAVGAIVIVALLAPLVGGYLLSQASDLDY